MMDHAAEAEEELFQCHICLDSMVNRKPRSLHCLHTFCHQCLDDYLQRERSKNGLRPESVACPTCRYVTPLRGGLESLSVNFMIEKCYDKIKQTRGKREHHCQRCNVAEPVVWCKTCDRRMCAECREKHDGLAVFRNHPVHVLSGQRRICRDHQSYAAFVCTHCSVYMCMDCALSPAHRDHQSCIEECDSWVNKQREKVNEFKKTVEGALKDISAQVDHFLVVNSEITDRQMETRENAKALKSAIDIRTQEYVEELEGFAEKNSFDIRAFTDWSEEASTFLENDYTKRIEPLESKQVLKAKDDMKHLLSTSQQLLAKMPKGPPNNCQSDLGCIGAFGRKSADVLSQESLKVQNTIEEIRHKSFYTTNDESSVDIKSCDLDSMQNTSQLNVCENDSGNLSGNGDDSETENESNYSTDEDEDENNNAKGIPEQPVPSKKGPPCILHLTNKEGGIDVQIPREVAVLSDNSAVIADFNFPFVRNINLDGTVVDVFESDKKYRPCNISSVAAFENKLAFAYLCDDKDTHIVEVEKCVVDEITSRTNIIKWTKGSGIAMPSKKSYIITEKGRQRILRYKPTGTAYDKTEEVTRDLVHPGQVGIGLVRLNEKDPGTRVMVVSETKEARITIINMSENRTHSFGQKGSADGCLNGPRAVAITPKRTILVADRRNHRVSEFDMSGQFLRHVLTKVDGLYFPTGIAYKEPHLWVTECPHYRRPSARSSIKVFRV